MLKPEVIFTDKLVIYDEIAGPYFGEYDDKILIFGADIANALRYIRYNYDYTFTGDSSVSWLKFQDINKIELAYNPINKADYYVYNEICQLFIPALEPRKVLTIGNEYGLLEYLYQHNIKYDQATCIITNLYPDKLDSAKHDIRQTMSAKNIIADVITTPSAIYKLLDFDLEPVDIYTYNNFEMVRHFELNFAHINIIGNIIGIISGLKYTKSGGTFIIHMYSIINKIHADLYLLAKQYFARAELYMPECTNKFKQSGTWAVFTGFKGITAAEYKHLLSMVSQIQAEYPNGVHDSQIYDPAVRKLCWAGPTILKAGPHVPYISGFFNNFNPADKLYEDIREFNTRLYKIKLAFCTQVIKTMKELKYPEHAGVPNARQVKQSLAYMRRWNIAISSIHSKRSSSSRTKTKSSKSKYTYLIKSTSFDQELVKFEFEKRGNWEPYDGTKSSNSRPVDFLFIDGKAVDDVSLYKIKSNLKNLVGDSKKLITDKHNLYINLSQIPGASKFLPKTIPFSIKNTALDMLDRFKRYFKPGKPYICKMVKGGAGMGIITTDKFRDFRAFMEPYYKRMQANPAKFKLYDWVLQEYITDPWLVNGRKMHLRQLMFYQPRGQSYYMYSGEFALAEKPYKKGAWTDKDIHDTHFHNGAGYEWPFAMNFTMEQWLEIKRQFDMIYSCVLAVMANKGECYPDSKKCFEMLGMDFMITRDLRLILIEVNDKIGMTPNKEFTSKLFGSMLKYIVDEHYPPLYSQQEKITLYPIKKLGKIPGQLISRHTKKMSSKYLL